MGKTKIQWSEFVWNPVSGCTPISEGCRNCFAARMAATRLRDHPRYTGLATFSDGKARWTGEVRLNHDVLAQPLHWKKPRRIFVASMSDLFHPDVPISFISPVFEVINQSPQHIFQILTKRPQRMLEYLQWWEKIEGCSFDLENVWAGVSVENQAAADERREYLRQCPAAVKFVSYEPALAPVDWTGWEFVSQIISGGESGPGARPSHPNWHRATRDFCQANGIAYFMKQWGEWMGMDYTGARIAGDGAECFHWSGVPMPPFLPGESIGRNHRFDQNFGASRIGKKRAGHLLDGCEWQEFPQ